MDLGILQETFGVLWDAFLCVRAPGARVGKMLF